MPGRPRSEASQQAIIQATIDLLIEDGYGSLTMEGVRGARRRRKGDDLPPLGLQGGARA